MASPAPGILVIRGHHHSTSTPPAGEDWPAQPQGFWSYGPPQHLQTPRGGDWPAQPQGFWSYGATTTAPPHHQRGGLASPAPGILVIPGHTTKSNQIFAPRSHVIDCLPLPPNVINTSPPPPCVIKTFSTTTTKSNHDMSTTTTRRNHFSTTTAIVITAPRQPITTKCCQQFYRVYALSLIHI